jgi:hypothetical protein
LPPRLRYTKGRENVEQTHLGSAQRARCIEVNNFQ